MAFKNILEILKKNWMSFACGVVAVLALIATYIWPLPGMVVALQSTVDGRKAVYANVESLRHASRTMPVIDIENPAAAALTVFPSQAVIDTGEKATAVINTEAMKMLDSAVRMNTHTLLLDQTLPDPSGPMRFAFRDAYLDAMEMDPTRHPGRPLHFKDQILKAIYPPSAQEFAERKSAIEQKYAQLAIPSANPADVAQNKAAMDSEIAGLPELMRAEQSTKGNVYLSIDALSVNPTIRGNAAPIAAAVWSAQLMLWIQEDFCAAVARTNESSLSVLPATERHDVTNAPIKHVIRITVLPEPRMAVGEAQLDPTTPLPEQPQLSLSKRVSNALFEDYRFAVKLNVETAKIPIILEELARNQFLTINKCDISGVDSLAALQQGYVYGTQPISTLNMECEVLYMRKWSEPLMPPAVRAKLTQPGVAAPTSLTPDPNAIDPSLDPQLQ